MATSSSSLPALPRWLPDDVVGDVCRKHCTASCVGPCSLYHFSEQSLTLLVALFRSGRLTPQASQTICRFGLETIDDVAFAFSDRHQAEAQSLGQIWSYAQTGAAAEAVRLAKKTLFELRGRATICSPSASSPSLQPTIPLFSHTLKRRSPHSSTAAPTPMRDETTRVLVLAEWCHPGKLFPHMAMVSRRAAPQSACMTF